MSGGGDTATLADQLLAFTKSKVEVQVALANGSARVGTLYAAIEAPRGSPECRKASAWFAVVARGYSLTGRDSLGEHWFTVDNGDVAHLSRQDIAVRVDAIEQPVAKSTPGVVDAAEVARAVQPDTRRSKWTEAELDELQEIADRVKQAEHAAAREQPKPATPPDTDEYRYSIGKNMEGTLWTAARWRVINGSTVGGATYGRNRSSYAEAVADAWSLADAVTTPSAPASGPMSAEETLWRKEQAERFATVPNPEALRSLDDYANVPEDAKEMVRHRVRLAERDREVQAALLLAADSGEPVVLTLNRDGATEHTCKVRHAHGWRITAFAITPGLWGSTSLVSSIDCDLLPHVLACRPAVSKPVDAKPSLAEQLQRVAGTGKRVVLEVHHNESPCVHVCDVLRWCRGADGVVVKVKPPLGGHTVMSTDRDDPLFGDGPLIVGCREETLAEELRRHADVGTKVVLTLTESQCPTPTEHACKLTRTDSATAFRISPPWGIILVVHVDDPSHTPQVIACKEATPVAVQTDPLTQLVSAVQPDAPTEPPTSDEIARALTAIAVEAESDPSIDYPFFTPAEIRSNRLACDRERVLSELRKANVDRGCLWTRVRVEPEHVELIADQLREVGWSVEVDGVGGLTIREVKS